MVDITVPDTYGFVVLSALFGALIMNAYLPSRVMKARKTYKVEYPRLYSEKEDSPFNRVQRGHQNALEGYTTHMVTLLVGGLKFPIACAVGGLLYGIGRVLYMMGYEEQTEKRTRGAPFYGISAIIQLISCFALCYDLISPIIIPLLN